MRLRRFGRRLAWLMAGAAIGTTVVLLVALLVPVPAELWQDSALLALPMVLGAVLVGGLLGLVPGVRELEVAAARAMLEVRSELVVPARPSPAHRLRDVLLVQCHLLLGLAAAAGLTMLLPYTAVTLAALGGAEIGPASVPRPDGPVGAVLLAAICLAALAVAVLASWPLGVLAARIAARLLGPTPGDRLALALDRVDREAERTRIARDLHDGIGHALTVVSIQAAAGGRVIDRDPVAAQEALTSIEHTAREALVELDQVLATLREDAAADDAASAGGARTEGASRRAAERADGTEPRTDGAPLPDLDALLAQHCRTGMELRTHLAPPLGLTALQSEHLTRIAAELLTNAQRHGGAGAVELELREGEDEAGERVVVLESRNPLPAPVGAGSAATDPAGPAPAPRVRRGGRGLPGLRERLDLWGGSLEAGPHEGRWRTRAVLPLLTERPRR
ncbi:sensor histidine kinase [Brachybacterium sp. YJGR34]|uniref:sensor histidine kinase n=1 Tax=Brachybacterium sp. YJGR34 TaxID=2059911 RepID=UPI0013009DB8|nr:histidine kinase [Brachybacterium sp. YJGR34]